MSTVLEIESAIRELPKEDFWKLAEWFDEVKADALGERMQADATAGRLDFLFDEAKAAREAGTAKPWPENP
jgi:hypothetical protein